MNDNSNQNPQTGLVSDSIKPVIFEPSGGIGAAGAGAHRWMTFGAFGLLLVLGALAIYLFTGQSVLITFDPQATEVEVDGSLLDFKLGDRWLLHPGDYSVEASRDGYYPFSETITVTDTPQQEFLFSLVRLPGYINFTTSPETRAEVRLDGQTLGTTPINRHELKPGSYEIEILADRYQPWEATLEVDGGGTEQQLLAELVPGWSEVSVASTPEGATLWVDDQSLAQTPLVAEILMGTRQLQVRLPGYKTWSEELRVPNNDPMVLPAIIMEQADNIVRLSSRPSRSSVTLDGNYQGETPLELELKPGREYQFRFSKAGYRSASRALLVKEGDDSRLHLELPPILGQIAVTGSPADASVYVDGVRTGQVNQVYRLPARPHRIEVRRDGYQAYETRITPNPDLEQQVQAQLVSQEDIRLARTPSLLSTGIGYRLRLIQPNGTITLGSPRREQGRRANEFQRQVHLQRPFYIGIDEVSNALMKRYLQNHDSGVVEQHTLALPDQPAVRIRWDQAARFCNWLSQQEGLPAAYVERDGQMVPVEPVNQGFRLPTEAEWVLAARYQGDAGNRAARKYPWGGALPPPDGAGNYAGIEATGLVQKPISNYRDEFTVTAPVGHFPADNLGLNDLGGNVREWIHDFYAVHTISGGKQVLDPMGPDSGDSHVVRGASWRSGLITDLRLAWRDQGSSPRDDIGFRVARYAE